jgi:2-polyprenyl-3-methyl-5-hydroxy-6-metoxy-1,4-benzoquinol methylase
MPQRVQEADIHCPICGSGQVKAIVSKMVFDTEFGVYQCSGADCQHGFTYPLPSEAVLESMYAGEDLNSYQLDRTALKAVSDFFSHLFTDYIPRGFRKPGTLLDVGAGLGTFMDSGRAHGWEVRGIEFNKRSVELGRELFGLDIVHGNFYRLEDYFGNSKFDLINMNHVFEHVLEPLVYLDYLRKFLKPGGCVLITVPNILSDDFKRDGAQWSYIHIPAHISYFSRLSMDKLALVQAGDLRDIFKKVFQSSFNAPEQAEGEGLTSMYRFIHSRNPLRWRWSRG